MTREWQPRPSEDEVRRVIETLIRERFTKDEISAVRVAFIEDLDGSELAKVQVVYKGEPLAAKRTLPTSGELRRRLLGISEPAFPLVSFASKLAVEAEPDIEADD